MCQPENWWMTRSTFLRNDERALAHFLPEGYTSWSDNKAVWLLQMDFWTFLFSLWSDLKKWSSIVYLISNWYIKSPTEFAQKSPSDNLMKLDYQNGKLKRPDNTWNNTQKDAQNDIQNDPQNNTWNDSQKDTLNDTRNVLHPFCIF